MEEKLKTNVEVLESGATKLTVTIEAADIDARIKKAYKDWLSLILPEILSS